MRSPILRHVDANGIPLAYWDWPGEGRPVVLLHGIGLHGRTWDQTVRELPASMRVLAFDLRGHGHSPGGPPPQDGHVWWSDLGDDVAEAMRSLALPPALGVGHSMGGHAMVFAAARAPELFDALLLLDPTIGDPQRAARPPAERTEPHPVARRRAVWDSPEQMVDRFRTRSPFDAWDPAVLRDYCYYGLISDDARYRLACDPAFEAMVWGSMSPRIHEAIAQIRQPVRVVRAREARSGDAPGFAATQTWPAVATRFADGRDEALDRGHFFPLESPALAARLIADSGPPGR